ncbi:NAD(P)/FAD-dependent oxidoreductase [Nocardioides sp. 616]|uniref:phytoene desaturase family protein n=1 Tax=Nocardioides sp. 616 TaxID=2268090 RepID=UPI000CE2D104|nr:NAD(P)/FAD-dependent oxidoreductase [Nocardioides sp. 616]
MRVVVIGGGFGGLASAARLAKLGHEVTLLERSQSLGGALSWTAEADYRWDSGPSTTLVPAVVRDLFRKSGRPLERELELVPVEVIREHRFTDGTSVRLPGGSRARQKAAFDALGAGLGAAWTAYVDTLGEEWELLRRDYLERPWDPALARRETRDLLEGRESLRHRLRKALPDPRLRLVAGHPLAMDGHDLRRVPAWLGTVSYLEQKFGAWTVPGGLAQLGEALAHRLQTRRVQVLLGTRAEDLVVRAGRAVAVVTAAGEVDADAVVCAVDPHRLPALRAHVSRTRPLTPGPVSYLGLTGEVPDLPAEVVLHGDVPLVLRTGGTAPPGGTAWTVHGRVPSSGDLLATLAGHGLDVRGQVAVRVDRTPGQLLEQWGGSPLGVAWQGRGTVRRRLGPRTPVPGVYAAGAHATPGSGLPFVGLSAALVAQTIGPA